MPWILSTIKILILLCHPFLPDYTQTSMTGLYETAFYQTANTHFIPSARQDTPSTPSYHVAMLSCDKLNQEAENKEPDLRRCIGHGRLMNLTVGMAHEDAKNALTSTYIDEIDPEKEADLDDTPLVTTSAYPKKSFLSAIRQCIRRFFRSLVKHRRSGRSGRSAHY